MDEKSKSASSAPIYWGACSIILAVCTAASLLCEQFALAGCLFFFSLLTMYLKQHSDNGTDL